MGNDNIMLPFFQAIPKADSHGERVSFMCDIFLMLLKKQVGFENANAIRKNEILYFSIVVSGNG